MAQLTAPWAALPALPMPGDRGCPYDPDPEYARLRSEAPVLKVLCPTGITAWLVTRYADVREVLGDGERFSSRAGQAAHVLSHMKPDSPVGEGQFTRMDGREYHRFRRHVGPEVGKPGRIAQLRPVVQRIVDERLTELSAVRPPVDFYGAFAIPVTTLVIASLLGVPPAERELFERAAAEFFGLASSDSGVEGAMQPLFGYLHALVNDRRAAPGDDAVSRIIQRGAGSGDPFTDTEMIMICAGLLVAGFDTTATTMACGFLALLENPAELSRLRRDPALVGSATEEIVRYFGGGPGFLRVATRDTAIAGQPIKAGDYIVAAVRSANHDPQAFADAGRLDVSRRTAGHLGFGFGPHQCPGQQLGRLELAVTLKTVLRRVPSLRLAVPPAAIEFKVDAAVPGPAALPVTWDAILPARGG